MKKLYNTQEEITTKIKEILLEIFPNIGKTQLKIIPFIIFGMIIAESSSASKIAVKLKDDFCKVQIDSTIKRIRRFFTNKLFNLYEFYDKIIRL